MAERQQSTTHADRRRTRTMDRIFPSLYKELRVLARALRRNCGGNEALDGTELVHEVYIRLIDQKKARWQNRSQVLAVAAIAMRRILVDEARGRHRAKRGAGWRRVTLNENLRSAGGREIDVLALDECLRRLAESDHLKAQIVEMRYFGGLSLNEIAESLDTSLATVKRHWTIARGWLYREMMKGDSTACRA